jgi:hypothetical protein
MISLRKRSFVFLTISCLLLSLLMPFSAFARVTGASVLVFDPATNTISGVVYSTQPALTVDAEYSSGTPVHVYQTQSYSSVSDGVYSFQIPSTVVNGLPVSVSVHDDIVNLSGVPSVSGNVYEFHFTGTGATVSGTISEDGISLDGVHLFIHRKDVSNSYYNALVSNGGHFTFEHLPDGTYIVDGYYDSGWTNWINLPIHPNFTVQGGVLAGNSLSIAIPKNNVNGTIQLGNQPLNGEYLNLHSTTTQNSWYNTKIVNGSFSMYLPDGSYSVDGYSDPGTYQFHSLPIGVTFTVTNGQCEPLNILIPSNNVTGSVYEGSQAVTNAWVSIRSVEAVPRWKSVRIDNGAFQTYLPDGQYEVAGIVDAQGNFKAYRVPFTVSGGQLLNGPLQIDIPAANISGTVTFGSIPVPKGWMTIHRVGNDSAWYQAKIVNGAFQLYLPDGSYEVVGYYGGENSSFVAYKFPFAVSGGQASPNPLDIRIPANNVTGKIYHGSTPVAKAWLTIRSAGMVPNWYSAKAENGQFSLYLPDGKYQITGVTDPSTGAFTELDYTFLVYNGQTVSGPLNIVIPDDNVTGTIISGNTPVNNAWLDIKSMGTAYGRYHAKVLNGKFSLYLPDGSYEVKGYSSEGSDQYQVVSYDFTVVNGTSVPSQLQIVVPANNVFGSIATQAGPIANAWIMMNRTEGRGETYTAKIKNGHFELHLPDGTYRVTGYYDQQDQSFHQTDYTFTVSGGVTTTNPLSITVPTQNVTGTVVLNNQTVTSGWMNIYSLSDGRWYNTRIIQGTFRLYLPDGKYKAGGYWDDQGRVFTQLDASFAVSQGQTVPSVLTFTVPPVTLQGNLKNSDGTPVAQAWVIIKNTATNETRGFQTLSDGSFSARLPVGSYSVLGYSVNQAWYSLYRQTFSITEDNLTSPLSLQLSGYPVVFTGTVTQGGQALSRVWVLLKDDAGNHYYVQTDVTGTYAARIPSGIYTLVGVYLGSQQGWYSINQSLTSGSQPVTKNIEVKVAGQ